MVSQYAVDEKETKNIAVDFLQQHYSIIRVEKPVFEKNAWVVEVLVSSPNRKAFQVKVNAKTGHIIGY